jgi:hypothetical protein
MLLLAGRRGEAEHAAPAAAPEGAHGPLALAAYTLRASGRSLSAATARPGARGCLLNWGPCHSAAPPAACIDSEVAAARVGSVGCIRR